MNMNGGQFEDLLELFLTDLELREMIDVSVEDEGTSGINILLLLGNRG